MPNDSVRPPEESAQAQPRFGHRLLALAAVVHLLFWISLPTGLIDPLFNDGRHRIGKGADFFQFYQAGANLLRGTTIYQYTNLDRVPYGPFNKYPPLLPATVGVLAQVLSPWAAYTLWVACIGGMFAALQVLLRRLAGPRHFPAVLALSLVFTPFYLDLYHGQTNTLMALLIAWMVRAAERGPRGRDSLGLALSFNVKLNTLLLVPALFGPGNRRWLLGSGALAALIFLPYFAFFPGDLGFFLDYAFGPPTGYFYQGGNLGTYPLIQELVYLFTYGAPAVTAAQLGWTAAVLAITGLVHLGARRASSVDLVSLWMCAYFLAFKFIWEHHLVMLLPVLAVEYARNERRTVALLWAMLAAPTLFFLIDVDLGPGYTEVQPFWTAPTSIAYHASKVLPLLALFAVVAARLRGGCVAPRTVAASLAGVCLAGGLFLLVRPYSAKDHCALALVRARENDLAAAQRRLDLCVASPRPWRDGFFLYAELLDRLGRPAEADEMRARGHAADRP